MAELHRFHDSIYDHGRPETRTQAQKEHLAMLVTSQSLHGSIIDNFDRPLEGSFKVKPGPALSQAVRVRSDPISKDYSRIANRYRVILPILGQLLNPGHHLSGSHLGTRWKFPRLFLSCRENLYVGSAYIHNQDLHESAMHSEFLRRLWRNLLLRTSLWCRWPRISLL